MDSYLAVCLVVSSLSFAAGLLVRTLLDRVTSRLARRPNASGDLYFVPSFDWALRKLAQRKAPDTNGFSLAALPPKQLFKFMLWLWMRVRLSLDSFLPADLRLALLSSSFWLSYCLYAAAMLGVADTLATGRKDVAEIAESLEGPVDSLNLLRLLRFLAANGVFSCDSEGRFGLTALSGLLCKGPNSMLPVVLSMNDPKDHRLGWAHIEEAVRKGGCGFEHGMKCSLWEYYDQNPELSKRADQEFAVGFRMEVYSLLHDYDWSTASSIVDVGGGSGSLVREIIKAWPKFRTRSTVFDRPAVIQGWAPEEAAQLGLLLQSGNFLEKVEPAGADIYILKHVLCDWNDVQSQQILKRVKAAMEPNMNSRLLIIDAVLQGPSDPLNLYKTAFDVQMMAMVPGRIRPLLEWKELTSSVGLEIRKVHDTRSISSIIEVECCK